MKTLIAAVIAFAAFIIFALWSVLFLNSDQLTKPGTDYFQRVAATGAR